MQPAVLVVGAGPVGLTMAAELARFGVPSRIIEKAPQRTDKSKALVLWSRTLELLDRAACGRAFVDAGLKVTGANIFANGRQIAHVQLDEVPTPHPYALMLPQSDTERLLDEHLNACGVKVERQVELIRFVARDDQVAVTLRHADGHEETLEVPWLIGCDGAHSTVRHGLGMQFEGNTLASDWILADIHLTGLGPNEEEVNTYWHASGVLVLFPISKGRYRMIADVGDAHEKQLRPDPTLAEVQAIIDQRGPEGIQISAPIWLSAFRINERKVTNYRAGRVFLVGDAAHVHSPAGGQGMNTGMQDAVNLAWKLAMVQRGLMAEEPLLESYSTERSAVGKQVLADAGHLTILATIRSGVLQSIRNHVASLVFGFTPVRRAMATKLSELSIGYPQSPLTVAGKHGHAGPAPGERAPVLDLADPVGAGTTPRFAVFAKGDTGGAALLQRHREILEPEFRTPFGDEAIWLVRPDGYVALVAKAGDWAAVDEYLLEKCKVIAQ
jgi:2-polyprenyl-6-methoxyphenol hydroxylase-like FAD-dependent oxidoreductase